MFKHFTTFFLIITLVLLPCSYVSASSIPNLFSYVYRSKEIEPAVINSDGSITAKFNIIRYDPANQKNAKADQNARITYESHQDQPNLSGSSEIVEIVEKKPTYIDLTQSTFTITGKLSFPITDNTLMYLNITDQFTIEKVPLKIELSPKFDYSSSSDMFQTAYLYWDSQGGSTLNNLINKDDLFSLEKFFGTNGSNFIWKEQYKCNNNEIFENSGSGFTAGCHNCPLELYFTTISSNSNQASGTTFDLNNPNYTKFPTNYIIRDLNQSALIIPNEQGGNFPLLQLAEGSTDIIQHNTTAYVYNNPSDKKIKYRWILNAADGSIVSAETDQPSLSPNSVSGIKYDVEYTITCNAISTSEDGTEIDSLAYPNTHRVKIISNSPTVTEPSKDSSNDTSDDSTDDTSNIQTNTPKNTQNIKPKNVPAKETNDTKIAKTKTNKTKTNKTEKAPIDKTPIDKAPIDKTENISMKEELNTPTDIAQEPDTTVAIDSKDPAPVTVIPDSSVPESEQSSASKHNNFLPFILLSFAVILIPAISTPVYLIKRKKNNKK